MIYLLKFLGQALPETLTEELGKADQVGDTRFLSELLNMFLYLGLLLALMIFLLWLVKRMTATRVEQANRSSSIKVIERRPLTPKTTIYVLKVFDKEIAIADSHNGVTKLSEIESPEEPEQRSFDRVLNKPVE